MLAQGPTNIEPLEGQYQTLAACALTQLTRRQAGKITKVEGKGVVRLRSDLGWELSFVDEGPGGHPHGSDVGPGERALPGHRPRLFGLATNPAAPLSPRRSYAEPGETLAAHADAVTDRLAAGQDVIEVSCWRYRR